MDLEFLQFVIESFVDAKFGEFFSSFSSFNFISATYCFEFQQLLLDWVGGAFISLLLLRLNRIERETKTKNEEGKDKLSLE